VATSLPLDYGEGPILAQAIDLYHGKSIYDHRIGEYPWRVSNYPPLFPFLWSIFISSDPSHFFPIGRAISTLSTFGTGLFIGLILNSLGAQTRYSLLGAFMFLGSAPVLGWGYLARVDSLSMLFSSVTIYIAFKRNIPFYLPLLIAALTAALFTRQTTLITLLPIVLYALLNTRRTDLFLQFIIFLPLVCFLLITLFSNSILDFLIHIVVANTNPLDFNRIRPILFVTAAIFPLSFYAMWSSRNDKPWISALLFLSLINVLVGSKVGASINYFLPLCLANSIAVPLLIFNSKGWFRLLTGALNSVLIIINLYIGAFYSITTYDSQLRLSSEIQKLLEKVQGEPKDVILTDLPGMQQMFKRPLVWQGFETLILNNKVNISEDLKEFLVTDGAWVIVSKSPSNKWPSAIQLSKISNCTLKTESETQKLYYCPSQSQIDEMPEPKDQGPENGK
jgi:hypothetical protein